MPPLGRALVLAPSEDRSIDLTNYVASDGSVSSPSTRRHACGAGVGWSSFLSPFFFSFVRSFLFKVVVETLRMLERLVWNLRRSFASTTVEIFFFSVRARTRHRCFGPSSSASSSSSSSTSIFLSLAAVTATKSWRRRSKRKNTSLLCDGHGALVPRGVEEARQLREEAIRVEEDHRGVSFSLFLEASRDKRERRQDAPPPARSPRRCWCGVCFRGLRGGVCCRRRRRRTR
mmetsp:Transcript_7037/g.23053  ORF Transcript_7037/g.23053 Transcript_7037/m.23053 type:complete len:231 (-) Transcript_7037:1690-2382(-)